jgi:hypothetical protein
MSKRQPRDKGTTMITGYTTCLNMRTGAYELSIYAPLRALLELAGSDVDVEITANGYIVVGDWIARGPELTLAATAQLSLPEVGQ